MRRAPQAPAYPGAVGRQHTREQHLDKQALVGLFSYAVGRQHTREQHLRVQECRSYSCTNFTTDTVPNFLQHLLSAVEPPGSGEATAVPNLLLTQYLISYSICSRASLQGAPASAGAGGRLR